MASFRRSIDKGYIDQFNTSVVTKSVLSAKKEYDHQEYGCMFRQVSAATLLVGAALLAVRSPVMAAEAVRAPAAAVTAPAIGHRETAIFAGGCFWGVAGVFRYVRGVTSATSGYAGGTPATANYDTVSTGSTGHAEAVRVVFDPTEVSYAELLRLYFSVVADPTELNRQGPDEGPQPGLSLHRDQRPPQGRSAAQAVSATVQV